MSLIRTVCVYCGSSPGADPAFLESAAAFGKILAEEGVSLVYGGGGNGLMGAVAMAVHNNGGHVVGVIPEFLRARELAYNDVTEMVVTPDMHERKRIMFERADAFVALPGGIGTLEELIEQMTWAQLGRHKKPVLFANINGFWDPLVDLLNHMKQKGFIHSEQFFDYRIADRVEDILPELHAAVKKRTEADLAGAWKVIEKL
jgi:uncharacterized protein (TIGR00730 family)